MGGYDGELTVDQIAWLRERAVLRRESWRRHAPDKPLGEPKMKFEDTFSAETVIMNEFFPNKSP